MIIVGVPLAELAYVSRRRTLSWCWDCRLCGRGSRETSEAAATNAAVDHLITEHASAKYLDTGA